MCVVSTSMTSPHTGQRPRYLGMWESGLKGTSKSGLGTSGDPQEGHRVFFILENTPSRASLTVSSLSSSSFRMSSLGIVLNAMGGPYHGTF